MSAYTLTDARHRAYEIRRAVADGNDPRGVKASAIALAVKASNVPTLGDFAEIYLRRREKKLRPATFRERTRYLGRGTALEPNPYFGPLQRYRLDQIDSAMIVREIDRLEDQGANGKPSAYVAQAARMSLQDLFKLAIECGHIEKGKNPVMGTRQPVTKEDRNANARDRVLTDAELAAIWNGCDGDASYDKIVRLLILTGCRRSEIGGMRWTEIDEATGVWTIPAARVKTGKKTGAFAIQLSHAALAILKTIPRNGDLVFGGRSADGFTAWKDAKKKLDSCVALAEPWVIHDLRRTLVTRMNEKSLALPHIIEVMVNHSLGSTVHLVNYNKAEYAEQKRAGFNAWADYVAGAGWR